MTSIREMFYCKHCRQLIEVVVIGANALICCGEAMMLLKANSTDAANEKHVPVVTDKGDSIEVSVGSVEHPMTTEHYIAFIEVLTPTAVCRKELKPGEKPFAVFPVKKADVIEVREFCNLHMLWGVKN
jgi:superoxide reductase